MEKYLYLILDVLSFSVPFLASFETRLLHFIRYWKPYFTAILSVGLFFIAWDILFTLQGVWSFNPRYHTGIEIFHLPLEEWLFFLLIPYASNFIHYSLLFLFPKTKLGAQFTRIYALVSGLIALSVAVINYDKLYTLCSFGLFGVLMLAQWWFRWPWLQRYLLSFVIIFIPFFIVNSWLTGSYTPEPVVLYNNAENLGIRLGTIPLEDSFYCFSLLYSSIIVFEKLKSKYGYPDIGTLRRVHPHQ